METQRRKVTLERVYQATPAEVWELWTTRAGIECWWGPEGFEVEVRSLDLRDGGELVYLMKAVGADQVEFMRKAGMAVVSEHHIRYTEVVPPRRLGYRELVDFVPGVKAYEVDTLVELEASGSAVRVLVSIDAMHDEQWSELARRGQEMQLDKLGRLLDRRPPASV